MKPLSEQELKEKIVDLTYDNRRHWFKVLCYKTGTEFFAALKADGIEEVEEDTIAYCDNYPEGDECGRMYFLEKYLHDPDTVSHEATHMALGIIARHGHSSIVATTEEEPELSHDLCKLVGTITGEILFPVILQDRKAWGEYVIGEDEPEPEIPVNDYYWRFRNELRARQRQRNQGEKTDE